MDGTTFCLSIYRLMDGHLDHFQFLDFVNHVMDICLHVFVWTYVLVLLWSIVRSRIAESYNKCMFNFLRTCLTVLNSNMLCHLIECMVLVASMLSFTDRVGGSTYFWVEGRRCGSHCGLHSSFLCLSLDVLNSYTGTKLHRMVFCGYCFLSV